MKHIIHHMDPLDRDDEALYAPLPLRLGRRDPMLEPVRIGQPIRGIVIAVLLGCVGWAVLLGIVILVEVLL